MKRTRLFSLLMILVLCFSMSAVSVFADETENTVPDSTVLDVPVVKASNVASSGKIKLTWAAIDGAEKYQVYRSTSRDGEYKLAYTASGTSYTNTGAKAGTTYYYKVCAVDTDTSAKSEFSAIVYRTCDLPRPVISITNKASNGKPRVTWEAVEGAVEYEVYRSTSLNGEYKKTYTTSGTAYTNTSAVAGTKYYYKVRAIAERSAANSAYSSAKYRVCDLAQPAVKITSATTSSIKLSWNKVTGASKYEVYRATSKTGSYKLLKTVTGTSFKNTSVEAGKTYYYKVKAIHTNSSANSAYSEIVTAKAVPMAPVLGTSATVTSSSIKINWEQVSGASGYYVYRRTSTSDSWVKVKTITSGSTTEFKNTDLSSGRYYYSVAAYKTVNGKKIASVKSDAIRCRTLSKPTTTAICSDTDLVNTISWNKRTGATGYQVYYRIGTSGSWKRAATVASDVLSYDHEVEVGKYYYYKVRAIYKSGDVTSYGSYSSVTNSVLWYNDPDFNAYMDGYSEDGIALAMILVENASDKAIRFYSEDGQWVDPSNSKYDCDLFLIDYEAALEKEIVVLDYIDVAAGNSAYITILADSTSTRYIDGTTVYLTMRYDGIYFDFEANCNELNYVAR